MAISSTGDTGQDSFNPAYTNSVLSSLEVTQGAYGLEATRKLSSNGTNNFEEAASDLTYKGESKDISQDANLVNLSEKLENLSQKIQEASFTRLNVSTVNVSIKTDSSLHLQLKQRNRSFKAVNYRKASGVDDPLLEGVQGFNRKINACSFNKLANRVSSGVNNGTARGKPVKDATGSANDVLVVENISEFSSSTVNSMAGYFSVVNPGSPGSYNDNYVIGSDLPTFKESQLTIIHEGLWKSNFNSTRGNCYLSTSLNDAPGISERIEGQKQGSSTQGIFTVLQNLNSSKSDIGFERITDPDSVIVVDGINSGDGINWQDFNMSQSLAEEQGLNELID